MYNVIETLRSGRNKEIAAVEEGGAKRAQILGADGGLILFCGKNIEEGDQGMWKAFIAGGGTWWENPAIMGIIFRTIEKIFPTSFEACTTIDGKQADMIFIRLCDEDCPGHVKGPHITKMAIGLDFNCGKNDEIPGRDKFTVNIYATSNDILDHWVLVARVDFFIELFIWTAQHAIDYNLPKFHINAGFENQPIDPNAAIFAAETVKIMWKKIEQAIEAIKCCSMMETTLPLATYIGIANEHEPSPPLDGVEPPYSLDDEGHNEGFHPPAQIDKCNHQWVTGDSNIDANDNVYSTQICSICGEERRINHAE